MGLPQRVTDQIKQSGISKHQLLGRFRQLGWIPAEPEDDLGEDFLVNVYFDGRHTGVNFYVQLKSIADLHERCRGDHLVYDLKVKDLKHWEGFAFPVVLIVWDVGLEEGRWAFMDDLISDLDQQRPAWRENKSKVRVFIPLRNTTDEEGYADLRFRLFHRLYPFLCKHLDEITVEFEFPDTEDGTREWQALEHAIKYGDAGTWKGRLKFPERLQPWIAGHENVELSLVSPDLQDYSVDIDVISEQGEVASLSLQLRVTKVGTDQIELSNAPWAMPLCIVLTIYKQKQDARVTVSFRDIGEIDAHRYRDYVRLWQALVNGGRLKLTNEGQVLVDEVVSPQSNRSFPPMYLQLLDKLCAIQERTAQFIRISPGSLNREVASQIDTIANVIEYGKVVRELGWIKVQTAEMSRTSVEAILAAHYKGGHARVVARYPDQYVCLFKQEFHMGPVVRFITGRLDDMTVASLEESLKTYCGEEPVTLTFSNVEDVEVYPHWFMQEAQRLSELLIQEFGAQSVYLFGSLAWSEVHVPDTDIDLAVRGLPPDRYFEAVRFLERASDFPVDLVQLDKLPDHLRKRILAEGKQLSEREPVAASGQ